MNYDDLIDSLHIAEPTRELCIKAADAIQQMIIDRNAFKDIAQKRDDVIERMQKELHEAKSELLKYREAEQDGKLVVIPWAAGDVIYEADPAHGVVKHTFAGEPAWMMHSYAVDDAGNEWYDGWGSSDETPFYKTREEAEAVLKGGEG